MNAQKQGTRHIVELEPNDASDTDAHADATNRHSERMLSDAQLRALDELAAGRADAAVAASVGVHRTTVTRWRLYRPVFVAALNRRRAEIRDASADRLRSMVTKALDRIEREIDDGPDGAKIALKVIEIAHAAEIGPNTTQAVAASAGRSVAPGHARRLVDVLRGMDQLDEDADALACAEGTAPAR